MAIIQKIRNQYGKIAGAVIAIALVSFIISDARNGSFGSLFGGRETYVVSVDGKKIESKEYETRVKEYELLTSVYSSRGPIDEATRTQIREQVLQSVTYEAMVEKICDKLGIITSEQEKKDLIYSGNAHPLVRQFNIEGNQIFNNEQTKQFDPSRVKGFEDELAKNPKIDPQHKIAESWEAVKNYVIRMNRIDKFNSMMSSAVYMPKYVAAKAAADMNVLASIRYVKVPFTAIPDNDASVKVTDADINAFIEKHKGVYKVEEPARSIEYVTFDLIPAAADSMRAFTALAEISDEFGKAKDVRTYVGGKTDDPAAYTEVYCSKKNIPSATHADTFLSLPTGTVFGPYFENNGYKLTRITNKKVLPDSVKIRHILIRTKERDQVVLEDSVAKKRMDSVIAMVKSGVSFDSLVKKYSDDGGSKDNHGEYWFSLAQRPGIDTAFGNFAFEGNQGETKLVKGENENYTGYHFVEVLERKNVEPTVQLATIVKNLFPSDSTIGAIFSKSDDFAAKGNTAQNFDAYAKKMGYDKRVADNIKESSFTIQGIGATREIIKWVFAHNVGEVSTSPFSVNNQKYVVCKLSGILEKGVLPLNATTRPMLEQRVKEEKKADLIAKKFKGNTLEAIGQATNSPVAQADSVSFAVPYIQNLGYEAKISGYTFNPGFAPNTVSPGLKGQGGVYFISLISKNSMPPNPMQEQMTIAQQKYSLESQLKSYFGQVMQVAVTKNAKIKYNMSQF